MDDGGDYGRALENKYVIALKGYRWIRNGRLLYGAIVHGNSSALARPYRDHISLKNITRVFLNYYGTVWYGRSLLLTGYK